ncbi:hypothetical protein C8R47DRAFT_1145805 [Mycena vitilis]|nr:hypothetical protein C8R47DRAFT_1145805 [Mycena vitilis]
MLMPQMPKKPPACDACKARRVLCHPQLNGAPCPRCVEKKVMCITTPVPRGRPRKKVVQAGSSSPVLRPQARPNSRKTQPRTRIRPQPRTQSRHPPPSLNPPPLTLKNAYNPPPACPPLTPEFVAHCFDALPFTRQYDHPLISTTSIAIDVRAVSFQLHLLAPQSRVLALCIICCVSLSSFHPSVVGDGRRPKSFLDEEFFSTCEDLLAYGVQRGPVFRALRIEALKAAWEIGIILQPSNENAASCYLLDLLEQIDFRGASRPWGNAYLSHVRALAPVWRTSGLYSASDEAEWVGCLMGDAIISARGRTPMLVTPNDQLLLCGPPPPSLQTMMASLTKSPSISLLWESLISFLYHIINMARQLSDTIAGDYARLSPLSEGAVINFMSCLSLMHSVLSLLLDHLDRSIGAGLKHDYPFVFDILPTYAYIAIFGFTGLVLPFYRELEYRETRNDHAEQCPSLQDRLRFLRLQAHEIAILGAREQARAIRYLPRIHYMPVHWSTIHAWAEFFAEEVETGAQISPEFAQDLETIANELKLLGYSLDIASAPDSVALIARLEGHASMALIDAFLPQIDGK